MMTNLMEKNRIRGAIVVGVDSNADRSDELDYSKSGARYADFLIKTLKPLVDEKFRTLPSREFTFTMGSSLGGLYSVALAWKHADIFSKAAALSFPAVFFQKTLREIVNRRSRPEHPVQIYLDHGTAEQDSQYGPAAADFALYLRGLGLSKQDVNYLVFPNAGHTEADWARRLNVPLLWLLGSQGPEKCSFLGDTFSIAPQ